MLTFFRQSIREKARKRHPEFGIIMNLGFAGAISIMKAWQSVLSTAAISSAALVSTAAFNNADATTLFCSDAEQTDGISVSDMAYDSADANDCYGVVVDNVNDQTDVDAIVSTKWGTGWTHLIQGDSSGETGELNGYTFTLDWDGSDDGTWSLSATGTPLPAAFDFVAALKGSNRYALWLFEDLVVNTDPTDGTWEIAYTKNGNIPDLSHITLFARTGSVQVPEPTMLGLLGLGLLGLGVAARRRRRG
ncbi:PEP-CTERM sorting domain-containing protein [Aquisalimonas lutea]|uniref:PEP-CTERM sorting domain-containing protein n=1 Tax=Aquisalimonas lutea TaxID=1327750 RepID=UPI0025B4A9CB|nr:PEP-CTERM sorting domain-containing protein [Aquisalimonas lutea]MDN3517169.1 PEP-CTERM sorting domain-containing protein [Aquisalimonas lutea]